MTQKSRPLISAALVAAALVAATGPAPAQSLTQPELLTRHALREHGFYDVDVRSLRPIQRHLIDSIAYGRYTDGEKQERIRAALSGRGILMRLFSGRKTR